ncbi:glutamate carboxypeptidase [Acinetobacter sp. YH01024]|uniref:glutamate carboxypeptidase n=1 Tax=Acinetobacter sp. YH01024 TaxID=2601037 RepID=UPI0015D210DC|nr:glutamate carboxypeptidase [Acinetobacter sp. YH01024]
MLSTLTQQRTTSKLQLALGCAIALSASANWAASPQEIKKIAESQKHSYLETLKTLVNIESGSKDIEGLNQIAKVVAEQLKATGAEVNVIQPKDIMKLDGAPDQTGPIVKAVLKGKGQTNIMLLAHNDTVYQKGQLQGQPFRIDGNKAYGLGILDDKQGVAAVIHVLDMLKQLKYQDYGTITVLINSDEEISSPGSRQLIMDTAQNQDVVLSFETGGLEGSLMLATSGIGAAYLDIKGRGSHAGVKPEAGGNALTELAFQIQQLENLSNPKTGLKLNWTVATAGKTRNVIPDHATAQADARSLKPQDFAELEKTLKQKVKTKKLAESQVEVKFEVRRPPLEASPQAKKLAATAQQIYTNELKLPMKVETTAWGGGTDAAFAGVTSKAAIIEGIGMSGDGLHSDKAEYILTDSIVPRLYLVTRLIVESSKK